MGVVGWILTDCTIDSRPIANDRVRPSQTIEGVRRDTVESTRRPTYLVPGARVARRWWLLLARVMLKSDDTIDRANWRASLSGLAAALAPGRWRRHRFFAGGFSTNVIFMLAGTALGQAASVLLSPALARIYTPDEFGYLSVYTAALTILGVIAALGFELAIPIAASEAELANLVATSVGALTGMTGVLALIMWLASDRLLTQWWLGPLTSHRCLLPIGFACVGGYYVMVAAATRISAFREIAWTRISQGLSGPISQIALGLLGAGAPGLAIGFIVGQSSGTFLLFSRVILKSPSLRMALSWRGVKDVVRRYARFPLFASWSRILDMAGSGPILFLLFSACYSSEIAGYMFLTERVIARPLLMVSTSLLQVFTGEAGQAVQTDPARLKRRFRQVVPRQLLLAASWIVVANLAAGWVFPVLFGHQWAAAIPYLRALSVAYLAQAVLHPVSTSLQIMERQALAAAWPAGRLVLVLATVITAWRAGLPAVTALWLASLAQLVACGMMLVLISWSIGQIERQWVARSVGGGE
jgi:O-antigen/teichoic acid export membrane protein